MPQTKTRSKQKNGKSPEAIYQEVTDRIVAALEEGHIPWERPWRVHGGVHSNLSSKRDYRGINQFLLDLTAMDKGYSQPYWVTYKQAEAMGGQVRKGEKSSLVVFWKMLNLKLDEKDSDGNDVIKKIPLLKYYRVFNVEQIDGIEDKIPAIEEERTFTPIERAQQIIKEMPERPKLSHGGDRAYYSPTNDSIRLPKHDDFKSDEAYYHTAYHEMIHSTAHEKRLHRVKDWTAFGADPYAKEELVAEMGAAMLAGIAEIDIPSTRENAKAYIQSWISRFKEDKKLLVQAASKAQQAADFIIETPGGSGRYNEAE